jgi:hypothetical protein
MTVGTWRGLRPSRQADQSGLPSRSRSIFRDPLRLLIVPYGYHVFRASSSWPSKRNRGEARRFSSLWSENSCFGREGDSEGSESRHNQDVESSSAGGRSSRSMGSRLHEHFPKATLRMLQMRAIYFRHMMYVWVRDEGIPPKERERKIVDACEEEVERWHRCGLSKEEGEFR